MKAGDKVIIKDGYQTKVHHKTRKVIAKAGDEVLIIAPHIDIMICESKKGERFSIHKSYLK